MMYNMLRYKHLTNQFYSSTNKQYVVTDSEGPVKVKEVPLAKSSLVSDDVCIIDGAFLFICLFYLDSLFTT